MNKSRLITVLCLVVVAVCVLALATDLFGLKKDGGKTVPVVPETVSDRYEDSGEYLAALEWQRILAAREAEGEALSAEQAGRYALYSVQTREDANRLEALLSGYSLSLRQEMTFVFTIGELCECTGVGAFLPEEAACVGYAFDDGSFRLEGSFAGDTPVDYLLERQMRGSFSETALAFVDGSDSQSWTYTTSEGVTLSLSMEDGEGLISVSLPLAFVSMSVHSEQALSAAALEELCEMLQWSLLG